MANQYVNKVELADGTTLIDISSDTVTADKMLSGYTAHGADGAPVTGSIANGTITNNTSGGTSSGTVNRGSQIKIGAGYYAQDAYYQAQENSGTLTVDTDGLTTVDGYEKIYISEINVRVEKTFTLNTTEAESYDYHPTTVFNNANRVVYLRDNKGNVEIISDYGVTKYGTESRYGGNLTVSASTATVGPPSIHEIVENGRWIQTNVTQAGTYFGEVVVPDPATLVYTVGSFWATEDSTKNPATELGFGTWTKVSPIEPTWNRLKQTSTWANMQVDAPTIYVWKRTA